MKKSSSCLEKDSSGNFNLKAQHQYYYQTQQQFFASEKQYCAFVVCALNDIKEAKLVVQRIGPDIEHWKAVLPKVTNFWKTCVLPEVLGRWYTRKHNTPKVDHPPNNDVCFCRTATDEDTVICCNPECPIGSFHLSCLQIVSVPKTWYCPNCRTLQNSCKKDNFLNPLGNQAHLPLPWPCMPFAYVNASLMKVTSLWNVTVLNASKANIFICHVPA